MPRRALALSDPARLLELAKALSDPQRLRILGRLPRTPGCDGVLNVNELAQALDLPQSTVSRHLAVLRRVGVVRSERMCRDVYYWADPAVLLEGAELVRALAQAPH